jgi:hypothetical protein
MLLFVLLGLAGPMQEAFAKRFANEYTEFELPPGWECMLEGSEWVCQSTNDARKKEAIIILVAKIRGSQDTLDQYKDYLTKSKSYKLPGGKSQVSEPKYTNLKSVNDQQWIDSLHLASEVPGFYTRYLATIKEDLGVAITFSVSKEHYDSYQQVFDNVISSVRVFRQKKAEGTEYVKTQEDSLFNNVNTVGDAPVGDVGVAIDQQAQAPKKRGGMSDSLAIVAILAVAGIGFIIIKKRKKK